MLFNFIWHLKVISASKQFTLIRWVHIEFNNMNFLSEKSTIYVWQGPSSWRINSYQIPEANRSYTLLPAARHPICTFKFCLFHRVQKWEKMLHTSVPKYNHQIQSSSKKQLSPSGKKANQLKTKFIQENYLGCTTDSKLFLCAKVDVTRTRLHV